MISRLVCPCGDGVAELTRPKGATKLTADVVGQIRELDAQGLSLATIGEQTGVSTGTAQVCWADAREVSAGNPSRRARSP